MPPAPLILNPAEPKDFPLGRWNLYVGGAGLRVKGYVNVDLVVMAGVDVAANAEQLPFPSNIFQRVECDAVLEHVRNPERVMREMIRVLAPGGYLHLVTPFCHPYHEYPKDFRRFTIDGLKELAGRMEVVAEGWRTGPTATLLVIFIEYIKLLLRFAHGGLLRTCFVAGYFFRFDTWISYFSNRPPQCESVTIATSGCGSPRSNTRVPLPPSYR